MVIRFGDNWMFGEILMVALRTACLQPVKGDSQEGKFFPAGLNVGLLPKAATPILNVCV